MTSYERQNWIINIENSAAAVESYLGSAVVKSVFERYGAHEIQDLNPSDLPIRCPFQALPVRPGYLSLGSCWREARQHPAGRQSPLHCGPWRR